MSPSCKNCAFAVILQIKAGGVAVCRRYPPKPVYVPGDVMDPGDTLQGYFPRLDPEDLCGEWKSKDEWTAFGQERPVVGV